MGRVLDIRTLSASRMMFANTGLYGEDDAQ